MLTADAYIRTLRFHGDHAASPTCVLRVWSQLISEAFSGGRTTFDNNSVMRHLDYVESILDLLGDSVILRELRKKKHDIKILLKYSAALEIAEGLPLLTDTPQRRASIPPGARLGPTRSPRLPNVNQPRSINSSINAVWSELGGSYATTPSLPPLDADDIKNSPCYGKGKGRARTLNKVEEAKPTRIVGSEYTVSSQDTENARRKENERANALQTLVGKQVPVTIGATVGAGARKEVRFHDNEQ